MVINLKIRLGYACLTKALDITSSSTITYTNYINKNYDENKLIEITNNNLDALKEILIYNVKNNIHFYRITSKLVPLATHEKISFNYIKLLKEKFNELKKIINKYDIRVDVHTDEYAVLNSMNKSTVNNTIEILKYHYNILKALGIKNKIIILHIGSSAGGKKSSITRFINNFNKLPLNIRKSIAVENDDKTFNIKDTLYICKKLGIPMILDYHHYICNNENERLEDYIQDIVSTWDNITPKFHFSSPKSKLKKEFRSHHEYINSNDFIHFLNILKHTNNDCDIMLEAKAKDDALSRLIRELKYKTNYTFIDESSFII